MNRNAAPKAVGSTARASGNSKNKCRCTRCDSPSSTEVSPKTSAKVTVLSERVEHSTVAENFERDEELEGNFEDQEANVERGFDETMQKAKLDSENKYPELSQPNITEPASKERQ